MITLCHDEEAIDPGHFRVGLFVSNNFDSTFWINPNWGRASVSRIGTNSVLLERIEPGSTAYFKYDLQNTYPKKRLDGSMFLHNCK